MPLMGSYDDELIQNEEESAKGFTEMVHENYMGGAGGGSQEEPEDETLLDEHGIIDLERLKQRKEERERERAKKDGNYNDDDFAMQQAISQFFTQQYNEQGWR